MTDAAVKISAIHSLRLALNSDGSSSEVVKIRKDVLEAAIAEIEHYKSDIIVLKRSLGGSFAEVRQ